MVFKIQLFKRPHANEMPRYCFHAVIMNKTTSSHKEIFRVPNEDLLLRSSTAEACAQALEISQYQVLAIALGTDASFISMHSSLFRHKPCCSVCVVVARGEWWWSGDLGESSAPLPRSLPRSLDSFYSRATLFLPSPEQQGKRLILA